MNKIAISLVLALIMVLLFVSPVLGNIHSSGRVDVNGDGIYDYYYMYSTNSIFIYGKYGKVRVSYQNVTYLKNLSDVIQSGYESHMLPNIYYPNGNLYDDFRPVENPSYTYPF